MVGLILQRAGFEEPIIAAGILHDVIEDTPTTAEVLRAEFGPEVAELVLWLSEDKLDVYGQKRPWEVRKQEHFEKLLRAPTAAKAIALADKLHNLHSVQLDVAAGRPIWAKFNSPKDRWLWNAERMVEACASNDPRIVGLVAECREALANLSR
jgi:(p)ppGpp synthase/HD superfamily hydrolase